MDYRDRLAYYGNDRGEFDRVRKTISILVYYTDAEGYDVEEPVDFPAHLVVCPSCDGTGSYVNPSIDSHGLSHEDIYPRRTGIIPRKRV